MSRPSKLWLLPVACAVIGVFWMYRPAYEKEPPVTAPSQPAPMASQSTPKDHPDDRSDKASTDSRAEPRVTAAPAAALPTEKVQPPIDPSLQLVFQAPSNARVGDNFDVRIMIGGRQSVGTIVVEVAYDPALLRVRTFEEIDYAVRMAGDRAFAIRQSSDGQVELVLRQRGTALTLPSSAALVQFEAIASGLAHVLITNVSAADTTERPVSWSAFGREIQIAID